MNQNTQIGLGLLIIIAISVSTFGLYRYNSASAPVFVVTPEQIVELPEPDPEPAQTIKRYRLDDEGFYQFFEALSLPGTVELFSAPPITGDSEIDKRIATLAEERGYKLRRIAISDDEMSNVSNGQQIQTRALDDWFAIKAAAKKVGIDLNLVSGYRSVDTQRDLFLGRLGYSSGATVSDSTILSTLNSIAPPGYSRHHNGYTIDLADEGSSVFKFSAGFKWLSANGYDNAKKYGFIPSYPENVISNQGPRPESWEYVWVGQEVIAEQIVP